MTLARLLQRGAASLIRWAIRQGETVADIVARLRRRYRGEPINSINAAISQTMRSIEAGEIMSNPLTRSSLRRDDVGVNPAIASPYRYQATMIMTSGSAETGIFRQDFRRVTVTSDRLLTYDALFAVAQQEAISRYRRGTPGLFDDPTLTFDRMDVLSIERRSY